MTDRELLQQVFDCLLKCYDFADDCSHLATQQDCDQIEALYIVIRARLAQPEQKPVAWLDPWTKSSVTFDYDAHGDRGIPLYTAPQPSTKAVLCKSEIKRLAIQMGLFGTKK